MLEVRAQFGEGPVLCTLHRVRVHVESCRDLGAGQTRHAQQDDLALHIRQQIERGVELRPRILGDHVIVETPLVGGDDIGILQRRGWTLSPVAVDHDVAGDCIEPAAKRARLEAWQSSEGAGEDLAGQILRDVGVAPDPRGDEGVNLRV